MTQNPTDPAQVLAKVLLDATEAHADLHQALKSHVQQVSDTVINTILAKTEEGAELRAALGVEVTQTTRVGKNLRAAMDAYTQPKTGSSQAS